MTWGRYLTAQTPFLHRIFMRIKKGNTHQAFGIVLDLD